jgi:hypothetical protein
MQWTVDRVAQIAQSNLWVSTVIFITWDDFQLSEIKGIAAVV